MTLPFAAMEEQPLSKEEQEALQKKLQDGAKNARIFQSKMKQLHESAENLMKKKALADEDLQRRRRELKAKDEELEYIKARYKETSDRLESNKKKADHLKKVRIEAEQTFSALIGDTRGLKQTTAYGCKEVETNYMSGELAAERGYTCKREPVQMNIGQMAKRGFF